MDKTILAALIGVAGVLGGVLLQHFLPDIFAVWRSREVIPPIAGEWNGTWYYEKDGEQTIYTEDEILLEKPRGFRVFGQGKDPEIPDMYEIRGRFSMSNIFTLSYRFPTKKISLTGVVLLKLDKLGDTFEGYWWGYTKVGITGGKVEWNRKKIGIPEAAQLTNRSAAWWIC